MAHTRLVRSPLIALAPETPHDEIQICQAMAMARLASMVSQALAYDFQYFLPQEFLLDLPLRQGSFAAEVISYVMSANVPDVHHKKVESGFFINIYADSDFNSEAFRSRRDVCTRVPVGGNPHQSPHMCEHPGSRAPRAEILEPDGSSDAGRFRLTAEFQFRVPGKLHIESVACLIWCITDTVCDDEVDITGVIMVSSLVQVRNEGGALKLLPHTDTSWISGPDVHGCHPDWLVRLFADQHDLRDGIRKVVDAYVMQNLQSELTLQQTLPIHSALNLTYKLEHLQFVYSQVPANESFVAVHASCTVHARARNGSTQAFPDSDAPWTGHHNTLPLGESWNRVEGHGPKQLVLLGGARFSQELLSALAQGMHYAGLLYSENSSRVKDATLYSTIDMARPEVDISSAGAGVIMRQSSLHLKLDCLDATAAKVSNFSLLNATFCNVKEQISVSAYVPNDHTAGIVLQVSNVTMGSANVTSFHSDAFMGSASELKSLAQQAIQNSLPLLNDRLNHTPLVFCAGGSSACSLVPFAPRPAVRTIPPQGKAWAGYVQVSWHCQCTTSGFYQPCMGFQCPQLGVSNEHALAVRQLQLRQQQTKWRAAATDISQQVSGTPATAWMSVFRNKDCAFTPDQTISFTKALDGHCMASNLPSLAPAFKLVDRDRGWYLLSGCRDDCSSCKFEDRIPVRRCVYIQSLGTHVVLSSSSDGCATRLHNNVILPASTLHMPGSLLALPKGLLP